VLKVYARELWRKRYHDSVDAKTSGQVIATTIVAAWERISPDVLEYAWDIFRWIGDWQDAAIGTDDEEDRMAMAIGEPGELIETPQLP
jgi:hypothetical protein